MLLSSSPFTPKKGEYSKVWSWRGPDFAPRGLKELRGAHAVPGQVCMAGQVRPVYFCTKYESEVPRFWKIPSEFSTFSCKRYLKNFQPFFFVKDTWWIFGIFLLNSKYFLRKRTMKVTLVSGHLFFPENLCKAIQWEWRLCLRKQSWCSPEGDFHLTGLNFWKEFLYAINDMPHLQMKSWINYHE